MASMSLRTEIAVSTWTARTAANSSVGPAASRAATASGSTVSEALPARSRPRCRNAQEQSPHGRKATRFQNEDLVASAERVGGRHLPTGMTVPDAQEGVAGGVGDCREPGEHLVGDVEQLAFVDVGHREPEGGEHPFGHDRGTGDRHHRGSVPQRHRRDRSPGREGPLDPARASCARASVEPVGLRQPGGTPQWR